MSLTSTTLAASCLATDRRLKLTAYSGLAAGMLIQINGEIVHVDTVADVPYIDVERGQNGTLARDHGILSPAIYGVASDFGREDIRDTNVPHMYTYGVNGALTRAPGVHRLAKATAGTFTLSAPKADEEGWELLIITETAAAHTVTLDSGTFNNETLSPSLTFAAAIGNCIRLRVVNGAYVVTLNKNVTIPSSSPSTSASTSASSSASTSVSSSASSSASTSPSASASTSASTSASSSASSSPSAT